MTASDSTVVALNGGVATNVLSTKPILQNPVMRTSAFRLKALANATGLLMTLMVGTRVIFQDRQVPWSAAGGFPSWLDFEVGRGPVFAGEALNWSFRNPTGANITVNWEAEVAP